VGYAVKQDLIDRFGQLESQQLTDKATPPAGAINDVVLGRALADADGAIDSALRRRYTLPLASVPKILVRVACDLARYFLYEDTAAELMRRSAAQDEAMKFLDDGREADRSHASASTAPSASVAPARGGLSRSTTARRVLGGDEDGAREFG
jgi:phage gp36-like protein